MKKLLLLLLVGSMNLSVAQVALTEGFESTTFPPTGWTTENTHATNFWKRTTNSITGAGSAQVVWIAADQDESLISPSFSLDGFTSAYLNFTANVGYEYMVDPTPSGDFMVLISNDAGGSWTQLWVEEDYGLFVDYEDLYIHLDLTNYLGQTDLQIKFQYVGFDADTVKLDDVSVTACRTADGVGLTALSDTTAATSWSGTGASYDFEWGPVGFTQGAGTLSNQTTTTFSFTGLTPGSGYSYYVRSNCGVNGVWQGPFTFYTNLLTPTALPYNFGFESPTLGSAGWTRTVPATGGAWANYTASGTLVQAGAGLGGCFASTTAATNAWLFSRGMTLASGEIITINYYYRKYTNAGTGGTNKLKSSIGTAATAAGMTTTIIDHGTVAPTVYTLNAPTTYTAPSAGTYYLGFNCYSGIQTTAANGAVFVDSVTITSNLSNNQFDLYDNMFIISPNPVENNFKIELDSKFTSSNLSMILSDINGKVVRQYTQAESYDASNLESGIYFLTITDGNVKEVKKLIKK